MESVSKMYVKMQSQCIGTFQVFESLAHKPAPQQFKVRTLQVSELTNSISCVKLQQDTVAAGPLISSAAYRVSVPQALYSGTSVYELNPFLKSTLKPNVLLN